MNHNLKHHRRVTRRGLILAGGAALTGTRLYAPDKDPNLIVILDFTQTPAPGVLEADLEIRRGFAQGSGNVEFSVRISGLVITDQGAWMISPKSDPIALLKTKSITPTPTGSTEVRTQATNQYKGPAGTFSVLLRAELLNPNGVLISASELTKPVTF